jgi:hypothetical protein
MCKCQSKQQPSFQGLGDPPQFGIPQQHTQQSTQHQIADLARPLTNNPTQGGSAQAMAPVFFEQGATLHDLEKGRVTVRTSLDPFTMTSRVSSIVVHPKQPFAFRHHTPPG